MLRKTNSFARVGGVAGIGFAATIVGSNAIAAPAGLPLTGADIGEVNAFFGTKTGIVGISSALTPTAWVLATLFGASVVAALRRSEHDRGEAWSLVGLAGLILQNATFAGVIAIRLALGATTAQDSTANSGLWALHDALFTLNGTFLALGLVGLSIAGLRAGLVRPWHGALGLLSAALLFSSASLTPVIMTQGGPLALLGLAGWLMWVGWIVLYGVTLIRLAPARVPA